jgi:hypothetical protein
LGVIEQGVESVRAPLAMSPLATITLPAEVSTSPHAVVEQGPLIGDGSLVGSFQLFQGDAEPIMSVRIVGLFAQRFLELGSSIDPTGSS